jgi:hypothetical protein
MEYVDMTPKWADIIDIYIASLEAGRESGKVAAREEIRRLAKAYDNAIEYIEAQEAKRGIEV